MKQQGRIVLASESPRRIAMLKDLGLHFDIIPSEVAELGYGGDPSNIPARISLQKIKAVRARLGENFEGIVVAADTLVSKNQHVLGKPETPAHAMTMLKMLSNSTHNVFTSLRLLHADGDMYEETVVTEVEFRALSEAEIRAYVATGEPMDKAGAYAIQGGGASFVTSIKGSYSSVVGLPLAQLVTQLKAFGFLVE